MRGPRIGPGSSERKMHRIDMAWEEVTITSGRPVEPSNVIRRLYTVRFKSTLMSPRAADHSASRYFQNKTIPRDRHRTDPINNICKAHLRVVNHRAGPTRVTHIIQNYHGQTTIDS